MSPIINIGNIDDRVAEGYQAYLKWEEEQLALGNTDTSIDAYIKLLASQDVISKTNEKEFGGR